MVACRLVDLVGRPSAANILGISVRELDKLVEIYELSGRFTTLRDPSAAITWARELMGVSKKLLVPTVMEAVVKKVNDKRITNSKDLRKLRTILPDPVARAQFLSDAGDLESAELRVRPVDKGNKNEPIQGLGSALEAMKNVPWTTLQELKGDEAILKKLDEAESLLKSLRRASTSEDV
jgi:ParB family chromosome partitioning protein